MWDMFSQRDIEDIRYDNRYIILKYPVSDTVASNIANNPFHLQRVIKSQSRWSYLLFIILKETKWKILNNFIIRIQIKNGN